MKEGTMKELFEAAGYKDYKSMEIGKFYKPKNRLAIQTLEEGKLTKKEVTGLVYKGVSKNSYKVTTPSGSLLCTGEHAIFNSERNEYEKVEAFNGTKALSINGPVEIKIEKVADEFDILDLEVEGTHSYISEGILSHNTFGAGAKAVGICIKRKNIYVDEFCTPVIWISQERANQQLMAHLPKPTGGEAVNFYPSTRFRVTPGDPKDYPKKNGEAIGIVIKLKNYKNKTATPFREAQLTMLFNGGIQSEAEYISMATELDVIEQHGGWFYILNPLKDMSAYVRTEDKKALKFLEDSGDLVKCQGADQVALWFQGKHPTPSCNHPDWVTAVKEKVDACLLGYNATLDKTAVAVDEEEEFQKEKAAQKARVEAGGETLKRGKVDEAFDEYERIAEEQKARGEATEVAVEGEDDFNGKIDGPSE